MEKQEHPQEEVRIPRVDRGEPKSDLIEPAQLPETPLQDSGCLYIASRQSSEVQVADLGARLADRANELAAEIGREYRSEAISKALFENYFNAAKHGMEYNGGPIQIQWVLGAETCTLVVADEDERVRQDFDPLYYAKMPMEEFFEQDFEHPPGGHLGIVKLVGRRAPGEETEGYILQNDISWDRIENQNGERVGTKVKWTVRSLALDTTCPTT